MHVAQLGGLPRAARPRTWAQRRDRETWAAESSPLVASRGSQSDRATWISATSQFAAGRHGTSPSVGTSGVRRTSGQDLGRGGRDHPGPSSRTHSHAGGWTRPRFRRPRWWPDGFCDDGSIRWRAPCANVSPAMWNGCVDHDPTGQVHHRGHRPARQAPAVGVLPVVRRHPGVDHGPHQRPQRGRHRFIKQVNAPPARVQEPGRLPAPVRLHCTRRARRISANSRAVRVQDCRAI